MEDLSFLKWDSSQPMTDEKMEDMKRQIEEFIVKKSGRAVFNSLLSNYIQMGNEALKGLMNGLGDKEEVDTSLLKGAYMLVYINSIQEDWDSNDPKTLMVSIFKMALADMGMDVVIEAHFGK